MADKKIAAVFRNREYSPNHIGTDAAILHEVCDQLRKRGCHVLTFSEDSFVEECGSEPKQFDAWLSMARSPKAVETMKKLEQGGAVVINSGFGVENCRRGNMCRILNGSAIPFVDFIGASTDENILRRLKDSGFDKCWVKQADQHSRHKEDVTFVRHAEEAQEVMQEFFMRGIKEAVVCRHLTGDLIRFYGVEGTDFFFWFMPMDDRHFAPDSPDNSQSAADTIDAKALKSLCDKAANALELRIYGGDCIRLNDGQLKIIDINDWPSFAPCRKKAGAFIARFLIKELR